MGLHDIASEFLREGQRHHFAEPPNELAAEKAYRSATLAAPEWGEPYHWLGAVLGSQGRTEEAVEAYQQAIRLLPTNPRPLIALGRLQTTCGHYAEAIRLLESGIVALHVKLDKAADLTKETSSVQAASVKRC